ncbi:hypothetical protein [Parachlamydia acanthamoebae]|uniref:hypothetical protein n=1 Tax=Parachlamydia acanthamoebae TaxID=83552 RepID=UPI0001C17312|nr:hypothetical protein [Parachlamydia acanthamoebae]EFB40143.1 hypothetical protein pah_c254o007 [Parachlamydia acanthamoebae str. Hall's coccus]
MVNFFEDSHRLIEIKYDFYGIPHARPIDISQSQETPLSSDITTSPESVVLTSSKRSLPSQQVWRQETVMGRMVNFFEQAAHILGKVWPKRSKKVDQRLMAAIHGNRIEAAYPGLQIAPLSRVLNYLVPFLKAQKGEMAPPKELIHSLQQCAKWSADLEKIGEFKSSKKRNASLENLAKQIGKKITSLSPGEKCLIPGGWIERGRKEHFALYEITKNPEGDYQLKIISRDPFINPQASLFSAGKVKIYPETIFNHLTLDELTNSAWLQALLNLQILPKVPKENAEIVSPNFSSLSNLFSPLADKIDQSAKPIKKYKTESQQAQIKNIWMVVDLLGVEKPGGEAMRKKRNLQLKVNTLFQFFEVAKKDLANNRTNQILLQEGIQNVSRITGLLLAENYLTEPEAAIIIRECGIIEKAIESAKNAKIKTSKKNPFEQKKDFSKIFLFNSKSHNKTVRC